MISIRVWALFRLRYIQTACSRVHRPTNLVAQLSMSLLAQLSFWLATFAGVSATGSFIQPPQPGPTGDFINDPTYKIGSIMSVEWESNLTSMDLRLFQQYPLPDGVWTYTDLELAIQDEKANWTVSLDSLISDIPNGQDAVLFFVVSKAGSSVWDSDSHYFNVSVPQTTTTIPTSETTTIMSSTSSLLKTSATQPSTFTSTSSPAATSAPDVVSHGLSNGAIAGIAVAVTIVGILVIGGLVFLAWKHFQKNRDQREPGAELPGTKMDKMDMVPAEGLYEVPAENQHCTQEMPTQPQERIHEAP